ncbi:energy-coupling factor ABC transporter permease [Vibrio caribbeanicus]|uniref:energy-coupling factor ABC transporter permease n=1 Tax=Vibrio caribbeanicus TaxID=701175 RepID=UPI0030D9BC2B
MSLSELTLLGIVIASMKLVWSDVSSVLLPKLLHCWTFQYITTGSIALLFLLWSVKSGLNDDMSVHFLGLTTLTLMYGWRCAYFISCTSAILLVIFGSLPLEALTHFLVISCLIPILLSYLVFAISYHALPRNIFVFIFVAGFFNAALVCTTHLCIKGIWMYCFTDYDWEAIKANYLILIPLLSFPEGLLNGMFVAVLTVFKPDLLRVFADRHYIYDQYRE